MMKIKELFSKKIDRDLQGSSSSGKAKRQMSCRSSKSMW